MNYYDETLIKIKELINDQKYDDALKIIDDEFSVPYLPKEFETELKSLQAKIYDVVGSPKKPTISAEEIFSLLNQPTIDAGQKMGLLIQLEPFNLRNYLDPITNFLKGDHETELKTFLIYLLGGQEIDHEFNYQVNHQDVKLNPATFDFKTSEEFVDQLNVIIEKLLPKDYPQLLEMSQIITSTFYVKVFPFINNYNLEQLGQAIVNRLIQVNGLDLNKTKTSQIEAYEKLLVDLEII